MNRLAILKHDVPASLVVFLVALPLCMAIAVASGMPVTAGLITGIGGGAIVGWFSGSPMQVSGPAAGLIVLVAGVVALYDRQLPGIGGAAMLGVLLCLAGLMQITAGLLRLACWFRAVSPSVVQGMLAGIGAIILVSQFHGLFDLDSRSGALANIAAIPTTIAGLFAAEHAIMDAFALGALTIAIIVAWDMVMKKRTIIPGSLVAVMIASILAATLGWQVRFVAVPDSLHDAFRFPDWSAFALCVDSHFALHLWSCALGIAAIASAESLLCATAVDQLHHGPRTKYNRELLAQGVGNVLCALLGGVPMTGVIVRSSANIDAGARSRASTILHGLWILGLVACVPWVLAFVPMASLAGILVYTGFKLINLKAIKELWKADKSEVLIYAATFAVIVGEDLLIGVLVGVTLSALKLLYKFTRLSMRMEEDLGKSVNILHLEGAATFIRLPQLAAALESVPATHELHVFMDNLDYIDHACFDLLATWAKRHQAQGGRLVIDWDTLHARFKPLAV